MEGERNLAKVSKIEPRILYTFWRSTEDSVGGQNNTSHLLFPTLATTSFWNSSVGWKVQDKRSTFTMS